MKRGGGVAALCGLLAACAEGPNAWDPVEVSEALDVRQDDPWCVHMRDIRSFLDGESATPPGSGSRTAALAAVRAEADELQDGDPFWPFRKALICEYLDGASEERAEFDWSTVAEFLETAQIAAAAAPAVDRTLPFTPIIDHLDGDEPDSITPVDLSNAEYCGALATSELALSQQRNGVVAAVSFPGSLRRAPDWFAHVQVAYHRWTREHLEGVLEVESGPGAAVDFGGVPKHCGRFHAALEGSKAFSVKDNLIFLLPELDDPNKAGRLEVTDAEGELIVLDKVLAAAQLDPGGVGGETVDFFPSDLQASPTLSGAVDRANSLPPPKIFRLFFDTESDTLTAADPGFADLTSELRMRSPDEPLRIALSGHADCVGPGFHNQALSEKRAQTVFDEVIRVTLLEQGFSEELLNDKKRFKLVGLGENVPAVDPGARCEATDADRRVVVVVQ
ncbi:MAG: hypothetical protein AAF360_14795 [Pseudomonadota bacterium]